jgi:exodeoxyribonuclease VII small subunit
MTEDERLPEELSFEEAMESLDSIVASLEGDQFSLEQMVSSYERGMKLLRVCRTRIDRARQRVESITVDLEGKESATLTDFAPMETADAPGTAESISKRAPRKKTTPDESAPEDDIRLF